MARKDSTALSRTTVSSTVASDSRGGCSKNKESPASAFPQPYLSSGAIVSHCGLLSETPSSSHPILCPVSLLESFALRSPQKSFVGVHEP